ncbi:hypothetical protein FRC10_006928 [Ceratobasidium sp. 414]|nr:hypothetical protein FRC10_006928 [Ceratobasidium sp. 414]
MPNPRIALATLARYLNTALPNHPSERTIYGCYRQLYDRWANDQVHSSGEVHREVVDLFSQETAKDFIPQLRKIGVFFLQEYERHRAPADLDNALDCLGTAASQTPDSCPERPRLLHNLASSFSRRLELSGRLQDLNTAISHQESSIYLSKKDDPLLPERLNQLGNLLNIRYGSLHELVDIENAIASHERALSLTSGDDPEMPARLGSLGRSLLIRCRDSKNLADIDRAIDTLGASVLATNDNDPKRPERLSHLGQSYMSRFAHTGDLGSLDKAVEHDQEAYQLASNDHPDKDSLLFNLGLSRLRRFARLGQTIDLDAAVTAHEELLESTPEGHPARLSRLDSSGSALMSRFERLGTVEDVNRAIDLQKLAVSLAPANSLDQAAYMDNLGCSLLRRFDARQDPADLDAAIKNLENALELTPAGHPRRARRSNLLGSSLDRRFKRTNDLAVLDRAISLINSSVEIIPDSDPNKAAWANNRSNSLLTRFRILGKVADIDAAITSQTQCISQIPEGRRERPMFISGLGTMYLARFEYLGDLADLDQAILYRNRGLLAAFDGHPRLPRLLESLGIALVTRAGRRGYVADCDEAIMHLSRAAELEANNDAGKAQILRILGNAFSIKWFNLHENSDLDEAIRHHEHALEIMPTNHIDRRHFLNSLSITLKYRGYTTKRLPDIDRSIALIEEALSLTPTHHQDYLANAKNLGTSLANRYELARDPADSDRAIKSLLKAIQTPSASPQGRFQAARDLIETATKFNLPLSLDVYQLAMNLVPSVVWLGKPIDRRYQDILLIGNLVNDAAAVAISFERYDLALEWLEQGRSIVWSQILQLRTPLDDLRRVDASLANRLEEVSRALDRAGTAPLALSQPTEQDAQIQRRLAEEWDELVNRARDIPDFQDFLRPRKVSTLARAAHSGAVVVVNVHKTQCDALAFKPGSESVTHIPLPNLSYRDINKMREGWSAALLACATPQRGVVKDRSKAPDPRRHFLTVLKSLWVDAAQPILERLDYLNNSKDDQLPRITWCLTGPLSFLPLHAAGIYETNSPKQKLHDFVVSSYTPDLGTLLATPASGPFRGILAIGMTVTPGKSYLRHTGEELDHIKRLAGDERVTRLEGSQATINAVRDAMHDHTFIHFACHASQNLDEPTTSAFHLHDGPLDLAEISRNPLKYARLAFLSACETATGVERLSEEAVHLAAGILMSGCPSVIATMWAVRDQDAPVIAEQVYARLFGGGPSADVAARALHAAVGHLREVIGEEHFEAWVPFIHVGS